MKKLTVAILMAMPLLILGQTTKVVGYLPTYEFNLVDSIRLDQISHLNIAFANPDMQGNLATDGVSIAPVVIAAHENNVEVFIALGGASLSSDQKAAWDTMLQPTHRQAFIANIVQYALDHNLQGVDVDLEWYDVSDDYSPFILELKPALAVYNLQLTAALPGSYRYPQITDSALVAFDWINVMSYDLRGPWDPNNPGQHSPYDWAAECIQYWENQGVPAGKLTLGVPFYGYDFGVSPVTSFTFGEMVNLSTGYAFLDQVGDRHYNGIPTIQAKTQLVLDEELAGIMIWSLGQDVLVDSLEELSLLKAICDLIYPVVGTIETLNSQGPFICPNPANNWLRVLRGAEVQRLNIYDMNGKLLLSKDVFLDETLSLESLPMGFYVLTLVDDDKVFYQKLLKL